MAGVQAERVRHDIHQIHELDRQERTLRRTYVSQIASLRRDIGLVQRQLEFESERTREVQRLIVVERQEAAPQDHLTAIARREEEIRAIREEKAAMLEWLQRGVGEAQRMSMQMEALRASADSATKTASELEVDRRRLEDMERRLTIEIEENASKVKRFQEMKGSLAEHTDQQSSLLDLTRDITTSAESDKARLVAEVDRLQGRARDVETVEIAMGCMAACVRRTLHTLEGLNEAVAKGVLMEEMPDDDGYDSGDDADGTNATPVVLASTKAKVARCDALLLTLRSSLKRLNYDSQFRQQQAQQRLLEETEAFQTETARLVDEAKRENERLRELADMREPQLRMAVTMQSRALAAFTGAGEGGAPPVEMSQFSLVNHIADRNRVLQVQFMQAEAEHREAAEKVKARAHDYDQVKQLRHAYRELESSKMVISSSLKTAEAENTQLRVGLFDIAAAAPPAPKPRPPWKAVPLT